VSRQLAALRCAACGAELKDEPSLHGMDRLHGIPGEFSVVICEDCGSGMSLPRTPPEQLAAYYPSAYGPYELIVGRLAGAISRAIRWYQGRRLLTRRPLSVLRRMTAGRLVDVGCGRGDLAARLVERGWHAVGVEPSGEACAVARARGVDARQGTLADVALEPARYDAAVFQHSLEHTEDPAGDLERVTAALRPGGVALVTVPNFGSWQRRRFGTAWFHLDLPRHRTHFTAAGLACALERAGLRVESLTTSTSTVGLPATIQYAVAGRCLFPRGLGLRVASGLCILALPLARLCDAMGGGGDQLHAVARRPSYRAAAPWIASSITSAMAIAGPGYV
jgi:SAM-dependent methyltransferase